MTAPLSEPRWISRRALLLLHAESLAEHGGLEGVRDEGLLDSALARPQNVFAYAPEEATLPRLAAAYGFGLARNHPFADGNKRAAFLAVGLFLRLNGLRLTAPQPDAIRTMLAIAAGELTEETFAVWMALLHKWLRTGQVGMLSCETISTVQGRERQLHCLTLKKETMPRP